MINYVRRTAAKTLQSLARYFDGGHPRDAALADMFGHGRKTASGQFVGEENALTISAVNAAVRIIAETIASLPLCVHQLMPNGRGNSKLVNHPAYALLHDAPNTEMTAIVARETMQTHVLLWGRAVAEIQWRSNGEGPAALWPIEPWRVQIKRNKEKQVVFVVDGKRELHSSDVLYIPGLSLNGIDAKGIVHHARESLGLTMSAQEFAAAYFGNGAAPGGFIETEAKYSEEAEQNMIKSFEKRHKGAKNTGRWGMLWSGFKAKPLDFHGKNAQFLETRQFQITEVARWFNVPPHMLKDLLRATYSNIEEQGIDFVVYCLRPWLIRWEQEINRKLLDAPRVYAKHNFDALMRGDSNKRATFYKQMFDMGALSTNEIRELEERNPIEHGDTYFVPLNIVSLERAASNDIEDDGNAAADSELNADEAKTLELRSRVESYGIAVRAGAVTPQVSDEEHFRNTLELPPLGDEVRHAWKDEGGVRLPITIRDNSQPAKSPGGPPDSGEDGGGENDSNSEGELSPAVVNAHRACLAEALARMYRKEAKQAKQAAKSPDSFHDWLMDFYVDQAWKLGHRFIFRQAVSPAIRAWLSLQDGGSGDDVIEKLTDESFKVSHAYLFLAENSAQGLSDAVAEIVKPWEDGTRANEVSQLFITV